MKSKSAKHPVESRIEILESLLFEANAAMLSAIYESNGVSDNEWTIDRERWKAIPRWPVASFWRAMKKVGKAQAKAEQYFKPVESERSAKWTEACYTASAIMKEFNDRRNAEGARWAENGLHRNIADAIYGVLRASEADFKDGINARTMDGKIAALVASGALVEIKPETKP